MYHKQCYSWKINSNSGLKSIKNYLLYSNISRSSLSTLFWCWGWTLTVRSVFCDFCWWGFWKVYDQNSSGVGTRYQSWLKSRIVSSCHALFVVGKNENLVMNSLCLIGTSPPFASYNNFSSLFTSHFLLITRSLLKYCDRQLARKLNKTTVIESRMDVVMYGVRYCMFYEQ